MTTKLADATTTLRKNVRQIRDSYGAQFKPAFEMDVERILGVFKDREMALKRRAPGAFLDLDRDFVYQHLNRLVGLVAQYASEYKKDRSMAPTPQEWQRYVQELDRLWSTAKREATARS